MARLYGYDWPEVRTITDRSGISDMLWECSDLIKIDYELDVQQKIAENNDRIELQIASARGHLDRLVASQKSVIDRHRMAGGRDSLIKASEGKIDRLQKQFEVNLAKLNMKKQLKHRLDDVAYFVVNVGKE